MSSPISNNGFDLSIHSSINALNSTTVFEDDSEFVKDLLNKGKELNGEEYDKYKTFLQNSICSLREEFLLSKDIPLLFEIRHKENLEDKMNEFLSGLNSSQALRTHQAGKFHFVDSALEKPLALSYIKSSIQAETLSSKDTSKPLLESLTPLVISQMLMMEVASVVPKTIGKAIQDGCNQNDTTRKICHVVADTIETITDTIVPQIAKDIGSKMMLVQIEANKKFFGIPEELTVRHVKNAGKVVGMLAGGRGLLRTGGTGGGKLLVSLKRTPKNTQKTTSLKNKIQLSAPTDLRLKYQIFKNRISQSIPSLYSEMALASPNGSALGQGLILKFLRDESGSVVLFKSAAKYEIIKSKITSNKHIKTLDSIYSKKQQAGIKWRDVENLFRHLNFAVEEGAGSRMIFSLNGKSHTFHKSHIRKELEKGSLKNVMNLLESALTEN